MISVSGAGDDLSDLDFTADRCAWFEAGPRRWFELSGGYRERRVALRVATGDDVEAAVQTDPRKLTIEDLGVSEDDLAQMDERQNTADFFEFDGKTWLYRLSREAQVRRSDAGGARQILLLGIPGTGWQGLARHTESGKRTFRRDAGHHNLSGRCHRLPGWPHLKG